MGRAVVVTAVTEAAAICQPFFRQMLFKGVLLEGVLGELAPTFLLWRVDVVLAQDFLVGRCLVGEIVDQHIELQEIPALALSKARPLPGFQVCGKAGACILMKRAESPQGVPRNLSVLYHLTIFCFVIHQSIYVNGFSVRHAATPLS